MLQSSAVAVSTILRKARYVAGGLRRQYWPVERLAAYQLARLRHVVDTAARDVPLYRDKYAAANVRASDLRRLEDLHRFPLVTKAELIEAYPERSCSRPLRPTDRIAHTSGSTGVFLNVAFDPAEADFLDAIYGRALFAAGYRPWHSIAYFWWSDPKPPSVYEQLGLMRKHVLPSEADAEAQLKALTRLQPRVIYNFPTSMALMAGLIEARGKCPIRPQVIICHGELLAEEQRLRIARAFGCDVFNQYGAQEFNRIAWDCSAHNGMHIDADSVIVEVLRLDGSDGTVARNGEEGELVMTGLAGALTPLVRYRIGDIGRLLDGPCACGRTLPRLEVTGGRADDFLKFADGTRISPRTIVPRIEHLSGFKQYRVIQRTSDRIEVLIVPEANAPHDLADQVRKVLVELVGDRARVEIALVDTIPLSSRGKFRCVINEVKA